jgi:DNA-binding NtrC family response regulator/tetratricopeptide (TPR) repeat protein
MTGDNKYPHGRAELGCPPVPPPSIGTAGPPAGVKDLDGLLQLADLHQAANNTRAAVKIVSQALDLASSEARSPSFIADLELRIANGLRLLGEFEDALIHVVRAKALLGSCGETDGILAGIAWFREGTIYLQSGVYARAEQACLKAYELLRSTDAYENTGYLELALGAVYMRLGEPEKCREYYENALFTFKRIENKDGIAQTLNNLGLILKNGPHWREALDYFKRALAISEELGKYDKLAVRSKNLGILYTKLCTWTDGDTCLTRAISINRELGNAFSLTSSYLARGNLRRRQGRLTSAAADYAAARELCDKHRFNRELVLCWEFEGDLAIDRGNLEDARRRLEMGEALARDVAPKGDLIPEIKRRLAQACLLSGNFDQARREAVLAARGARKLGDLIEAGAALRILGETYGMIGKNVLEIRVLSRSYRMLRQTSDRLELARAREAYAVAMGQRCSDSDCVMKVIDLLRQSTEFYREAGMTERVVHCYAELCEARVAFGDLNGAQKNLIHGQQLAEDAGEPELLKRVEKARSVLESRSAEMTRISSPEAIIADWHRCFDGSAPMASGLNSVLAFVTDRLSSQRAFLAFRPLDTEKREIVSAVGMDSCDAAAIAALIDPYIKKREMVLTADVSLDPRFADSADTLLAKTKSFVAISLRLIEGEGVLYLGRSSAPHQSYGLADLRVISALSSLIGLSMARIALNATDLMNSDLAANDETRPFSDYLTGDPGILRTFSQLVLVSDSTASIMILGETGTGKGLLTECVHRAGSRRAGPFVSVNCAAIPENLLESELFGHEAGAFTGAVKTKRGLFEEAEGGTIFLDEISRTSLAIQAKLLHALDTMEIRRVGATTARKIDVRIICASNADLRKSIEKKTFLEDLFYRLSDFVVSLPPLRDRKGDINLLWDSLFSRVCSEMNRYPKPIGADVRERLLEHEWRGNIRELIQVTRRLVALSGDNEDIGIELLPPEIRDQKLKRRAGHDGSNGTKSSGKWQGSRRNGSLNLREEISQLERSVISEALSETGWNRSTTARLLGISYPNLLSKIKVYELCPDS